MRERNAEFCGKPGDTYPHVEDADALYAEYSTHGVEFTRELANMPWQTREFCGEGLRRVSAGVRGECAARVRHGNTVATMLHGKRCYWKPYLLTRSMSIRVGWRVMGKVFTIW